MTTITPEQTSSLLAAICMRDPFGPRDHAAIELTAHTGLRVSELVQLNVSHVSANGVPRHTLHLPSAITKFAQARNVPLNEIARAAIARLLRFNQARGFSTAPAAPLLVTRKHERVSVRLIQRLVESLREKAGLDVPATPHSFRHQFAMGIMKATGNLRVTQQLLGHHRLNSTQVYTCASPDDLAAAVALLVLSAPTPPA